MPFFAFISRHISMPFFAGATVCCRAPRAAMHDTATSAFRVRTSAPPPYAMPMLILPQLEPRAATRAAIACNAPSRGVMLPPRRCVRR